MNIHKNAALTPKSRADVARRIAAGHSKAAVARAFGICARTASKWFTRYQSGGEAALMDLSSRPRRLRAATPQATIEQTIELRSTRMPAKEVARRLGLSQATVSRILRRVKLSRMKDLVPPQAPNRYEHTRPGAMIHIDIKKLNRFHEIGHPMTGDRAAGRSIGAGWEFAHVCIDDNSRIAFSQMKKDERKGSAIAFLKASLAYYKSLGIRIKSVMTDNGSCYRSRDFENFCQKQAIRHVFTKPYTPRTNGKAERFIQTALREWAYAKPYQNSDLRAADLPLRLHRYNYHRPHSAIGDKPPVSRIPITANNLLRTHT